MPDLHTPAPAPQIDGSLFDRYPNLYAGVACSFAGSARREAFAAASSFPEGWTDRGRTEAELRLGLAAVMDEENWKMPIERQFDRLRDYERLLVSDAVVFYTGSVPEFYDNPRRGAAIDGTCQSVTVRAAGYYEAVGS